MGMILGWIFVLVSPLAAKHIARFTERADSCPSVAYLKTFLLVHSCLWAMP